MHPTELSEDELLQQCELKFTRRSGPGGQHRNKVSTAVVIKHLPSECVAEASERRSQSDNRSVAVLRLRVLLAREIREDVVSWETKVTKYGGPSLRIALTNEDFPIVLADILNRIFQAEGEVADCASAWQTTASQIVRFLKQETSVLQLVNRWRSEHDRHPLR